METLRGMLSNSALAESLKTITELAKSNGIETKDINTFTTVKTFLTGVESGEVLIKIPIRPYESKHDLDPNNKCKSWFKSKGRVCKQPALQGTHHCFRHRPGGPAPCPSESLSPDEVNEDPDPKHGKGETFPEVPITATEVRPLKVMTWEEVTAGRPAQTSPKSKFFLSKSDTPKVGVECSIPRAFNI